MGKYDISSILLAIGERKAQERARNQALDLEREKMMSDRQFQGKQLDIQGKQADASIRASDAQVAHYEQLMLKEKNAMELAKEGNPITDVSDWEPEAKRYGGTLKALGPKAHMATITTHLDRLMDYALKSKNLENAGEQLKNIRMAHENELLKNDQLKSQTEAYRTARKFEKDIAFTANPEKLGTGGKGTGEYYNAFALDTGKLERILSESPDYKYEDNRDRKIRYGKFQERKEARLVIETNFQLKSIEKTLDLTQQAWNTQQIIPGTSNLVLPDAAESLKWIMDNIDEDDGKQVRDRAQQSLDKLNLIITRLDRESQAKITGIFQESMAKKGMGGSVGKE